MKYPLRRVLALCLAPLLSSGALQACKKKDGDAADPLTPPTLEFLGASNTNGDEFEPGEDLVIGCDGYLTLDLGPEGDDSGTILNWTLRPPNVCGSLEQCGYVTIELLDSEDAPVATLKQAVASPFLDLSAIALGDVVKLRATLTLGDSGVPFEDEGVIVMAIWEGTIARDCADPGDGGAGGADTGSGGGTSTGGAPAMLGGAGGLGGTGIE